MIGRTILLSAVLLAAAVAGCGIPDSSGFEPVARDDVLFGLADTTTTSTTMAPTTTIESTSTTAALETSTTIATEPVELYFVSGSQLNPVSITLARPAGLSQVMTALVDGPGEFGDLGLGIRSVIPPRAEIMVTERGGVAEVDLPSGVFDTLSATDQRLLFGQIVLTLTRRPGIGQVRFTLNGEPTEVFTGGGDVRAPGETVSEDDYRELTTGATPTTTTSTTTTAPAPIEPTADTVTSTTGG